MFDYIPDMPVTIRRRSSFCREVSNKRSTHKEGERGFDSTGEFIWLRATRLLCEFAASHLTFCLPGISQHSAPLKVLELGAGAGLSGLFVAKLLVRANVEFSMVLTDRNQDVIELLEHNIAANGLAHRCNAQLLDWSVFEESKTPGPADFLHQFDILIGSDVVYCQAMSPLRAAVAALLKPSGLLLLSLQLRVPPQTEVLASPNPSSPSQPLCAQMPDAPDPSYASSASRYGYCANCGAKVRLVHHRPDRPLRDIPNICTNSYEGGLPIYVSCPACAALGLDTNAQFTVANLILAFRRS